MWVLWAGRAGEDRRAPSRWVPLSIKGEEGVARILVRVGTCDDELRLMGVMYEEVPAIWGSTGER